MPASTLAFLVRFFVHILNDDILLWYLDLKIIVMSQCQYDREIFWSIEWGQPLFFEMQVIQFEMDVDSSVQDRVQDTVLVS